ncbi:MUM1 protein, partial [Rhinopomastus cyanomelas]|nr:MUM1 protein [Rhinopomastus cyanomelas]
MAEQEYVLCAWNKRLWPAKVKSGVAGTTPAPNAKETLEVEIIGMKKQISTSRADVLPLKEELIEKIAVSLDQRSNSSEVVEELKYRHSLKIALDVLTRNSSAGPGAASGGPKAGLSQESSAGSISRTPLPSCRLLFNSEEKVEPVASKRKRELKNNPQPEGTKPQTQKVSLVLEERAGSRTDPLKCDAGDVDNGPDCQAPASRSQLKRRGLNRRLLTKSKPGNQILEPKEERNMGERQQPSDAGSPESCGNDSPRLLAEGGSPCGSDRGRRANSRRLLTRTFVASLCPGTSEDLEKSISSESESLAKQLDGRKKPKSLKRVNGEQETGTAGPSSKKWKCEKDSEASWLEPSEVVISKSPSPPSSLLEEEEEDEELPCVLSLQEPQAIEEGILVWCKLRGYPYWPAVVKTVRRKHKKACVLLIDGSTNEKKRGFSVPFGNLKHFDCKEKQDLIDRAKEGYRQEIEWCIRLISDYRIRVGCHSFTGSFLEYFAADISYPVRKESYHSSDQMTFLNKAEEDVEESPSETSNPTPRRKLLPDRSRAARDRENKKIVEFIVKTKGAEEHLLAILKSRKQSRWLKDFLNSSQYMTCVETYLEDEEQLDLVVNYLKEICRRIDTKNLCRIGGDGVKLILDVLLPEAIIYAISAVDDIDYKKAEEKYIRGPSVSRREREIFEEEILERKRQCKVAAAATI